MNKDQTPIRGMLDRAQKSFVRCRPGSVLILVVALLVLMALIGTAYMSMAQADRATSVQHSNNNEIELLMDGLANIVKSTVSQDLFYQGSYRPGQSYNQPTGTPSFQNYTGLGIDANTLANAGYTSVNAGSAYLSARVPELPAEIGVGPSPLDGLASITNRPTWSFITAPLIGGRFSTPILGTGSFLDNQTPSTYTQRSTRLETNALVPGVMPGHPGVRAWIDPSNAANGVVAADADGDGIPDSGFIKLPMGSINGVTYYAAFRILDSSSAVNVNTAWQHNPQLGIGTLGSAAGSLPGDFFPSSIDLSALATQIDSAHTDFGLTSLLTRHFGSVPSPTTPWVAIDDNALTRADLPSSGFNSALEASWMQLGRRTNYPGYASAGTAFGAYLRGDGIGLLRNFVVRDPTLAFSTLESDLPYSLAANVATSRYDPSASLNWYAANFAFLDREFSAGAQNPVPLRALLTTENPVSNFAPNTYNFRKLRTTAADPLYAFGDCVLWTDNHRYVCINPGNANNNVLPLLTAPVVPGRDPTLPAIVPLPVGPPAGQSQAAYFDNDTWVQMPWHDAPTKISVNTGTFGQLWLSYCAVMGDQSYDSFGNLVTAAPFPNPSGAINARMFRSPLRISPPVGTPLTPSIPAYRLTPLQVMQLRAAIAAVNTIDMRDNDDDVTSRKVALTDNSVAATFPVVYATVFGQERQPFITEIYATNQNVPSPNGYVAIKLFNPYNTPLDLSNYRLGTILRDDNPVTAVNAATELTRTITEITPDTTDFWTGSATAFPPIIPANSFIIISSAVGNSYGPVSLPANVVPAPPRAGPALLSGQIAQYTMTKLNLALNNELVLLRPRQGNNAAYAAAGNLTVASGATTHQPVGDFSEPGGPGGAILSEMVPVDSYDLTGLIPQVGTDVAVEWHYLRPSDAEGAADSLTSWHWVYPGHYRFNSVGTPPPHAEAVAMAHSTSPRLDDGTHVGPFPGGSFLSPTILAVPSGIVPTPLGPNEIWSMGQYFSPSVSYPVGGNFYRDIPLRLNSPESGGPNNPYHLTRSTIPGAEPGGYPYGGFARNGDIVQVPFIGSYKLQLPAQVGTVTFMEMNSVTMDSVMALATAQTNWNEITTDTETLTGNADPLVRTPISPVTPIVTYESVGRFLPLNGNDVATSTSALPIDDLGINTLNWRYHFATKLFDYLTVESAQQDTFPSVDPAPVDPVVPANLSLTYKYPPTSSASPYYVALPVANANSSIYNAEKTNTPAGTTEQSGGIHGLININTAPWRVLATVPWLPPNTAGAAPDNGPRSLNAAIAMSIVTYRDVSTNPLTSAPPHGPFKTLFELNNVPITVASPFAAGATIPPGTLFKDVLLYSPPYNTASYTDLSRGNLQAAYTTTGTDITQGDFQNQNLMLNRVSNLLTTRSDHFTAYILLQGWKDAETPNAKMVVQRRAAYLIDRTGIVGASNATPSMTYVPNN